MINYSQNKKVSIFQQSLVPLTCNVPNGRSFNDLKGTVKNTSLVGLL